MNEKDLRKLCNENKLKVYDNLHLSSMNQISIKTGVDFKNVWRYIQEFKEKKIIPKKKYSQTSEKENEVSKDE